MITEVSAVESIAHTKASQVVGVAVNSTESASVIPTMTAVHSPTVASTIGYIEVRTSEIEITAVRIAGVDSEVPETSIPVEGTIEVGSIHKSTILPVEQDVTEIEVASCPVCAVQVVNSLYTHQIVEIDFICCLILILCEVQFVCHLVREEQCLVTCLFITHGVC